MKLARLPRKPSPTKAATGVQGLDEITGGGLPHGRTTLLVGDPGSGGHTRLRELRGADETMPGGR